MALPSLSTPKYDFDLISTNQKIKYRPFLVKEEKILLIASESNDDNSIIDAIAQIVKSCTDNEIDLEKTAIFDVEHLFLNIRAKSVDEIATIRVKCPDDDETFVEVKVDLTEVKLKQSQDHDKKVQLTDNIGMVMRYPVMTDINLARGTSGTESTFDMIAATVDQIYDGDKVYERQDMSSEEIIEFLEQLSSKQFQSIQNFFDTMPKLSYTIKVQNPNTGVESEVTLEGFQSFFG